MANMSYCRFENTLRDLQDCYHNMDGSLEELSKQERSAKQRMIELCKDIANEFGDCEEEEDELTFTRE